MLITVPVNNLPEGRFHTIDDLDMGYWIPPTLADGNVFDLTTTRHYLDRYPGSKVLLHSPLTIYFEDQGNQQGVNRTLRHLGIPGHWKGNLVVVKHIHEELHTDMDEYDKPTVIEVMRRFVISPIFISFYYIDHRNRPFKVDECSRSAQERYTPPST